MMTLLVHGTFHSLFPTAHSVGDDLLCLVHAFLTAMMGTSDANPDALYSAVASVSGTVAAILGGFVLAALLNLASQRESKAELLRERRRTIGELQVRLRKQEDDNAHA